MFRVALRLLLAAALGAVPLLVRADVYRWVDEDGATHFATTRDAIPRRYRDSATVIPPAPHSVSNPSGSRPPERANPPPSAPPPAQGEGAQPAAPPAQPGAETPAPPAQGAAQPTQKSDAAPAPSPAAGGGESATGDPRQSEIAELEGQIERDRETLRGLISTPRLDSSDLASDPRVREIAERLPRLQAELAALRKEAGR